MTEILFDKSLLDLATRPVTEMLPGVEVARRRINIDDRGSLVSLLRADDGFVTDRIEEVYVIHDRSRNIVRAFHGHRELIDWFSIIRGSAKFILIDARKTIDGKANPFLGGIQEVVLSDAHVSTLAVPPGVFHGWMSLEDDTILCSIANRVYNHAGPDEFRIPPDSFGIRWGVTFR